MVKASASVPLLPHSSTPRHKTSKTSLGLLVSLFALLLLLSPTPLGLISSHKSTGRLPSDVFAVTTEQTCGQAEAIIPSIEKYNISTVWEYKDRIIKWHQGVVRIKTEVFDEMGDPGVDHRWDVFEDLHTYLKGAYPLVHKHLVFHHVDTFGLVCEWVGTDKSLQPLMLTGHQDVVPVLPDTVYQWEEDPYSGKYDGEFIWGRGSNDDKSSLTAILASIELLLEAGTFQPTRTVILGFGHDEERGGERGAPAIRDWMLEHYGADSVSLLVDEGEGINTSWGRTFGLPAVAEKGRFNLNLTLSTLGGHSSIPPKHTNIGLMALLIAQIERNPHPIVLQRKSPIWGFLQCAVQHAPDMPSSLKKSVTKSLKSDKAFASLPEELIEVGLAGDWSSAGMGSMTEALLTTTQATDIIYGGVKVNALPEVVTTIINHRVDIASQVSDVTKHIYDTILPIADEFHLAITGLGFEYTPKASRGHIFIGPAYDEGLGPAPISPTDLDTAAWRWLAGTSRGVWASRPEVSEDGRMIDLKPADELIMSPYMSTGNTDTRRYWDLTRNIYRWRYFPDASGQGIHTINERVSADAMVEYVRFYQALILNVDSATDL
ncbi:hypothetical protein BCR39DRAFT_526354 [Naematelia encephala]|uniref:Uncharacterized protein n=1 Tax=Naematelia encephala TaxID=71784 RepID=A0A1Y2B954_9TREE|nr:hypothetical protein BCR39DRAFT_526354 [Naematelia encephala]